MGRVWQPRRTLPTHHSVAGLVVGDASWCPSGGWCHWPPLSRPPEVRGHTISLAAAVEPWRSVATAARLATAPPPPAVRDVVAPPAIRAHHSPRPRGPREEPRGGGGGGALGAICLTAALLPCLPAPVFAPLCYHRGPPWPPRLPAEWDPRGGWRVWGGVSSCQPSSHGRCRGPLCAPTWRGWRRGGAATTPQCVHRRRRRCHCWRRRRCLPGCLAAATVRLPTVSSGVVAAAVGL